MFPFDARTGGCRVNQNVDIVREDSSMPPGAHYKLRLLYGRSVARVTSFSVFLPFDNCRLTRSQVYALELHIL